MKTRHLLLASILGGLISAVLVNTPFLNLTTLVFCAGFWIGPIVAVWLYRRVNFTLTLQQAVVTGILAGAWHALFGLVLSPIGLAGAGGFLNTVGSFVPVEDLADVETALRGVGGVLFNLVGVLIDLVFGLFGGLVGGALFRAQRLSA
jgi:hypothetical protein